ncbi:hypothetical protein JKY72_01960 [Candidatus Gracilibacteria bacterium]|nr:hypothetical protein [Candidatus Gracilibacteria bacterium]
MAYPERVVQGPVVLDFAKVCECCGDGEESRRYEVNGVRGVTHIYFKPVEEGKVWVSLRTDMRDYTLYVLPNGEVEGLDVLPEGVDIEVVFRNIGLQLSGMIIGADHRCLDVRKRVGVVERIGEKLVAQVAVCTLDANLVEKYICSGIEIGIDRDGHYYLLVLTNDQDSDLTKALLLTEEDDGGSDLVTYGIVKPEAHGVAFTDIENFQLFLELFKANL